MSSSLKQSTVVVGLSGSGKTTYLMEVVKQNPDKSFLILNDMFNFNELKKSNAYLVVDAFDTRTEHFKKSFLKLIKNNKNVKFVITMQEYCEEKLRDLDLSEVNIVNL